MAGSATQKKAVARKKTAAAPASSRRSTAASWKRNRGEDLELPSGNVALVKRPGITKFISEGCVPDPLMGVVDRAVKRGKGLPLQEQQAILKDPEKIRAMEEMMDKVLCLVVVEPKVVMGTDDEGNEIPESERSEDVIYADEVDMDDKVFIFNFAVGGTRDLARFRREHGAALGSLRAVHEDGDAAE